MVDLWWRDTESVGWLTVLCMVFSGLRMKKEKGERREMLRFGKSINARFEEINLGLRLRIGAENMGLGGRIWEIT
ncbi:hypothetical protein NC651_003989 [Populus alba x Populus x berolinensis]|nr:hypothetical protein NC651_003989 [Populus alba x Populus x berolinensis]